VSHQSWPPNIREITSPLGNRAFANTQKVATMAEKKPINAGRTNTQLGCQSIPANSIANQIVAPPVTP
jgi:hypothetical protein